MMAGNETIVDRVVARLRAQPLGDLITEEDLHDIVKQAIPRAFFEPQFVKTDHWGKAETKEPLIVEIMRQTMKKSADVAVSKWLDDHAEMVAQQWKEVFDAGLLHYVETLQDVRMTGQLRDAMTIVFKAINDDRQRKGETTLPVPFF